MYHFVDNKGFLKWGPVSLAKRRKCWSDPYFWIHEFRNKANRLPGFNFEKSLIAITVLGNYFVLLGVLEFDHLHVFLHAYNRSQHLIEQLKKNATVNFRYKLFELLTKSLKSENVSVKLPEPSWKSHVVLSCWIKNNWRDLIIIGYFMGKSFRSMQG